MAVNINNVYQTVLTIINKDNRGYLTPDEFNRLANLAQLEIFEAYFLKDVTIAQSGVASDDGSDPMMVIADKINEFHATATVTSITNLFSFPGDYYRLEVVDIGGVVADQVSHKDVRYINLSPLTAPTETQPVFTRMEGGVELYPNTIRSIVIDYLKQPVAPEWIGVIDVATTGTNEPFYDLSNSTDFELHPSEEHELVYKILSLAGVVIRDPEIQGVGQGKEQQLQSTEQ